MWTVLAGCAPSIDSELGQLHVTTPDLSAVAGEAEGATAPMIAGTVTCPTFACGFPCPGSGDVWPCFAWSAEGSARVDGGCATFTTPGEAVWAFDPVGCDLNDLGYDPEPDQLVFEVIDPGDVTPVRIDLEDYAESDLSPGPVAAFPSDWQQPDGEPYHLVAASPFRFWPDLRTAGGGAVGYTLAQLRARSDDDAVTAVATEGRIEVTAGANASAGISFELDGSPNWPLVEVVGVEAAAVRSIEVVVAYQEGGGPVAARAVARDADGGLVWGAPVRWSVDADVPMALGEPLPLPGPDYVVVGDSCVEPPAAPVRREGTITATFGDVVGTTAMSWMSAAPDGGFTRSDDCPPEPRAEDPKGCGCGSAGGSPGSGVLWVALGASLVRRRR